ncbi:MAG: potassium-transporting ATPase subunit KdpB [Fusobacteria bacterium]|nr:potassium-transporting ATPase subunit KdpB [Fusobacteriota bacterium]
MKRTNTFITKKIFLTSFLDSFVKLNPKYMAKNPVMFIVEIGFFITLLLSIIPNLLGGHSNQLYNIAVTLILFITLVFANFSESIAEGRGKAQANSLKKSNTNAKAKRITHNTIEIVDSSDIKKNDIVLVEMGDIIPNDGEIIEGIAMVDESVITGESAPVLKEAKSDFNSVTGGTTVKSDFLKIRITAEKGESFLDKMILLVEGATRQKTPNEIALSVLLITLSIIFIVVVATLYPISHYVGISTITIPTLVALLVCLIPTTIGGLLSAIGISGMDRVTKFNVIALSGKAVEACGDVDTMILDKTGTITFGNRMASEFIPVGDVNAEELIYHSLISSYFDDTPEGKSIVTLASQSIDFSENDIKNIQLEPFSSVTRMSGITTSDGKIIKKGASSNIIQYINALSGTIPQDLLEKVEYVSKQGGTPLVVCAENRILGVIYLKDTVKPGLSERFNRLREIGIKTIMCTGDNPLTAEFVAREAGVDEFVAQCTPQDKIDLIIREQKLGKIVAMTGDGTNDAPALAQANVGIAMNNGTIAAKEAANMIDLDSDPTKILEVVEIGKQLLITRGSLTTFSIANDVAKYFAILPALFTAAIPQMNIFNIMHLHSANTAILSALIFNAIIIPLLIPIAIKGVKYKPMSAEQIFRRNIIIYGLGGIIVPFIGIKIIDILLTLLLHII